MGDYDGTVALVTGGGMGIGEACVTELAGRGAHLVVADLEEAAAERVAAAVRAAGGSAVGVRANVADEADCAAMVGAALDAFGRLDVAVNNAGIGGRRGPVGDLALEDWRATLAVNLDGAFLSMREELRAMVPQGAGAIVNIGSIQSSVALPDTAAYTASKHGLLGLTRSAAIDYAQAGIRVNCVGPGVIATPSLLAKVTPQMRAEFEGLHPSGRMGEPQEIARLVAFLGSPQASNITGAYYLADGGYTAQ
ncbi:MAG TPA: glucose 1-dehydrogenase [Capillimicrobium sp.]|nr:glucose 1-dehydrogenase [Capillimicrobium sp.]